jgi:hypothetical protein
MTGGKNRLYLIGVVIAIGLFIVFKNKSLWNNDNREKPRQEETDRNKEKEKKVRDDQDRNKNNDREKEKRPPSDEPGRDVGFNRRAGKLIFTKHARCRMGCRHIDESEVQEILENGTINDRKSEPAARPDPKYALEGKTHDGQQVRIIFAPSDRGMVVITVIDLGTDWSCNCK